MATIYRCDRCGSDFVRGGGVQPIIAGEKGKIAELCATCILSLQAWITDKAAQNHG